MATALTRLCSLLLLIGLFQGIACESQDQDGGKKEKSSLRGPTETLKRNFYDLQMKDIEGNEKRLEDYRGQVIVVVNVASECGFTDTHYKGLVRLQQIYGPTGKFTVLAFPCNDFGNQEPGNEDKIWEFAKTNYNVNFPMFSKVQITNQPVNPIYKYLIAHTGTEPNWNFYKYLVSHSGEVINAWGPWVDIDAITDQVRGAINKAVKANWREPNKSASGPPMPERKDYGDGAGGGQEVWSEGPANAEKKEPGRAGGSKISHEDL